MRGTAALAVCAAFWAGCSPSTPSAGQNRADSTPARQQTPEPLPSDVPIPIGLQGRTDSALPGSKFHVVQGQIPSTLPDAAAAIRKQAEGEGWKATGEVPPTGDGSVQTLNFEKDARSLKITLVRVQNVVTALNLLIGPK
jgi:hypothetical protein